MDDKLPPNASDDGKFAAGIGARAERKLEAKRHPGKVWLGLGMMGLIGWTVVVPTLLGTAAGIWLDSRHPGAHAWTLALLMAGLTIGCTNAWYWVAKEDRAMRRKSEDNHE